MKKILLPMLAALLMGTAFTSCSTEEVILESSVVRVKEVTVYHSDWVLQDGLNYAYCEVDWPVLTDGVVYGGNVVVYVYDNSLQNPLPYVYPTNVVYDDGTTGIVGENLRFDMEPGRITLIMQDLDGYQPQINRENTPSMTFRIVATIPVKYIIEQ
ncbi:MAG: hypothetical protein J6I49_02105 [Bacteroidales bacterium]|nr:hypothetical protein [Bacteroidales bacterium]